MKECFFAGYRPCKRCHPLEANGKPPEWAQELISRVEAAPDARLKAADLRALGITPERARRWFQQHYGMSFAAWCRGNRSAGAFTRIRQGATLDDAIFDSGFRISQRIPRGVHPGLWRSARPEPGKWRAG